MALVNATVSVDFDANYSGDHRVCWRVQGSGSAYDCTTIVNCVGGGSTCNAVFTVQVNTTSCDGDVIIEGYIQAACEDILSTGGRLPFVTNAFTPTPTCLRYEITCERGPIESVTIVAVGTGYTVGDPITVTRDPGDTSINDATLEVGSVGGSGEITSVNIVLPGEYQIPPTLTPTGGTDAVLEAVLRDCLDYNNFGNDCAANPVTVTGLAVGSTFAACSDAVPGNAPDEYIVTQTGCCVAEDSDSDVCFEYQIENQTGAPVDITYTACGGTNTVVNVADGVTVVVCAIDEGVLDPDISGVIITNTAVACS